MVSIRRARIGGLDLNGDTISRGSVKCRWRLAWECRCGSLGYSVPGPVLSFLFASCLPRCEQCFPDACSHCQDVLPKCMWNQQPWTSSSEVMSQKDPFSQKLFLSNSPVTVMQN